ncbi:MAG: hypothetical protein WCP17_03565, partial [bacterium]
LAQLVRAQSLYLWGPWFESKRTDKRTQLYKINMHEYLTPIGVKENRGKQIKARAHLDAFEYIKLEGIVSLNELEIADSDQIIINVTGNETLFNNAREALKLTPEEMVEYTIDLRNNVKDILLSEKNFTLKN